MNQRPARSVPPGELRWRAPPREMGHNDTVLAPIDRENFDGAMPTQLDRHVLSRVENWEFIQREATRASRFFWGPWGGLCPGQEKGACG